MPRVTKDRDVRRQEILEAAMVLFMAQGAEGTSVTDIVKRVGVAQGTFYYHFPSKDTLLDALAERLAAPVGEAVTASASDPDIPVPQRLRDTLSAVLDLIELGRPHLNGLVKPGNEGLHDRVGTALRAHLEPTFAGLVAEGNGDGSLSVEPANETVELLLATVFHLTRAHAHGDDPERVARLRTAAERLFARGLVLPQTS